MMKVNNRISLLAGSVTAALSMFTLMVAPSALAQEPAAAVNQEQGNFIPQERVDEINKPITGLTDELYKTALTEQQKKWMEGGKLEKKAGWWQVGIKGEPYPRGFQYGYLIAPEFKRAWKGIWSMTYLTSGVPYSAWKKAAMEQTKGKIPDELMQEMQGLADGLTAAGLNVSVEDVITWNDMLELTGYWWPSVGMQDYTKWVEPGLINASAFQSPYPDVNKKDLGKVSGAALRAANAHGNCSAFVATGKATAGKGIVIGHTTFDDFWSGQFSNVILNITPTKGNKMAFQTQPGMIESGEDFWVTSAGLAFVETTIANVSDWAPGGTPEFIRARQAAQYGSNIDEWVQLLEKGNNGGYANTWLIGDINTNRIAKYGQGRVYQYFNETESGYFTGENVSADPRIRYIEGTDSDFNDIRQQEGARRLRWMQLMEKYDGKIDAEVGKNMLADTYDVYLMKPDNPSSRNICAEYDKDPQPYVSDPNAVWNTPYQPAGSVDGKVADANDIKNLTFHARFGRANGREFDAQAFLRDHAQWAWEKDFLESRPSQPWVKMPFLN